MPKTPESWSIPPESPLTSETPSSTSSETTNKKLFETMIGTTEEEKKKLKDQVRTIVEEKLLKDEKLAKDVLHLQKIYGEVAFISKLTDLIVDIAGISVKKDPTDKNALEVNCKIWCGIMMDKMNYENQENTAALSEEDKLQIIQHEVKMIVREKFLENKEYEEDVRMLKLAYGEDIGSKKLIELITGSIKEIESDDEGNHILDEDIILFHCKLWTFLLISEKVEEEKRESNKQMWERKRREAKAKGR